MFARILLLLLVLATAVLATAVDKQAICAKPNSGCGAPKTVSMCEAWHGCSWRSKTSKLAAACINDPTCSTGKPQQGPVPSASPVVPSSAPTKSPVVITKAPFVPAVDCIDVPQDGGCPAAGSLHDCERHYCCTWFDEIQACRVNGFVPVVACPSLSTKKLCQAQKHCRFSNNKCSTIPGAG